MNFSARARRASGSLLLASSMVLAVSACVKAPGPSAADFTEEVEYLFARAEHSYATKDYLRARVLWQQLSKDFPYSQYAALAELRIADSYFAEKAYASAAEAYRAFTRMRPRHEKVPYAEFRVVECYERQMPKERLLSPPTFERDLTDALVAYREGRRYIVRYRDSEYTQAATDIVKRVADRLAAHELYAARYYQRRDNHVAAMRRGQYVVTSFPESTRIPEAYLVLAQGAFHAEEYQVLRDALAQIANSHPTSPEVGRIEALVASIPAPPEPEPVSEPSSSEFSLGIPGSFSLESSPGVSPGLSLDGAPDSSSEPPSSFTLE